jgi:hypothetical protein
MEIFLALGYRNRMDQKCLGFVAATGFLSRVLSFLRALSHLERIAHRPTTYSTNLNHLSHLERALYHWPTRPHTVQHCVVITTHRENRHRISNKFNNGRSFLISQSTNTG